MPQMGRLLWMSVVCLNMFLLYLLNMSIHFSSMINPLTKTNFLLKFF